MKQSTTASNQPAIHIHIPDYARPADPTNQPIAEASRQREPLREAPNEHPHEIPPTAHLPLEDFAKKFKLASPIKRKLQSISIRNTTSFTYLSPKDIRTEAGLNLGEYGEFLYAKDEWMKQANN